MDHAARLLNDLLQEDRLILAVFSNRRKKGDSFVKATIRPVLLADRLNYQVEYLQADKAFHKNLSSGEVIEVARQLLINSFRQAVFFATDGDYTVLANKPDRIHIKKSAPSKQATGLSHDREKQYILREDVPNAMLEQLGVMTPSGKVVAKYRDKFKQINRFLEIVRDCLPFLPENPLIVDFGCGKSYLTFAMYHYLNEQLNLGARFVGLDLKHDVIAFCSETARALGYSDLQFLVGDIAEYAEHDRVDMVVTLHACDKATDEALIKAVEWDADVILSVPCCQHELFPQLAQPAQNAILQHGLLKERFASILTDALRAQALQYSGYSVAAIEFIDMEHTPKNLMLRCNRKPIDDAHAAGLREEFLSLCAYWNVQPSIARLLEMRRIP